MNGLYINSKSEYHKNGLKIEEGHTYDLYNIRRKCCKILHNMLNYKC